MFNIISSSRYKIDRKRLKKVIGDIFLTNNLSSQYSLNLVFVGRNKMKQLSQKYKGEKETLPVLSFIYNEKTGDNEILLGEVVICFPLAVLLSAERNKRVDEVINELVKHGIENLIK
jgi:ssRNA-specific RNase YbeY (16S rRNA maturation enzyme)